MPKIYSLDLRERVAAFVQSGRSCRAASAHFMVSVSFVVRLMRTLAETGSLRTKPGGGRRHAKIEPHRAFLLRHVEERHDITMPELAAELFAATGTRVDPASLSRWFIRNGYRFKKNLGGQRARSLRRPPGPRDLAHEATTLDEARSP